MKLNSIQQVLIFLLFVGHQTVSSRDVEERFNIANSSVNVIIRKVGYFLRNMSPQLITWRSKQNIFFHSTIIILTVLKSMEKYLDEFSLNLSMFFGFIY